MKKISFIHFTALIGLTSMLTLGLASAENVRGHVRKASGDVFLITGGTTVKVTTQTTIPVGSKLVTGADSQVSVDWLDGAHSILEPNSRVEVQTLQLSEDNGQIDRKVVLKLDGGKILCKFLHTSSSVYILKAQDTVIMDKGTSVSFSSNDHGVCCAVISGSVTASKGGSTPTTVTAGNSFCSTSDGNSNVTSNDNGLDSSSIGADGVALIADFGQGQGEGGDNGDVGTSGGTGGGVSAPAASNPLTDGAPAAGGSNPGNSLQTSSQLTAAKSNNPSIK